MKDNSANNKYFCPCCGYNTFDEPPPGTYSLCEICFWEDDPLQFEIPDFEGGANVVSLNQAKSNFEIYGVSNRKLKEHVRSVNSTDVRDPQRFA